MTWDQDLLQLVNPDHPVPILDQLMVLVSLLGYMVPYSLIGFAILRRDRRADALLFWTALLVTEVLVGLLKMSIDRPRPEDVRLLIGFSESASMPSGHAARAFAGAFALWRLGPRWRTPLVSFAFLTMLSRVYVGQHYPSDVLVGAAVGTILGIAAHRAALWVYDERAKQPSERSRLFERAYEAVRWTQQVDYLYSLRQFGRLTQDQAERLRRVLRLWGRLRIFFPILMILLGVAFFALVLPEKFGPSASCLGAYFVPIVGIEVGIPLCLHLGIPAWLIVTTIVYLDLWLSLFFILNFDYLHRIPRLGQWLLRKEEKGLALARRHPWLFRLEFIGVAGVTFFPIPGAGIVPGALVGRFIGMPKISVWGAVMLGTVARVSLYVYSFAGLLHVLR